jgi:hypothetical protein
VGIGGGGISGGGGVDADGGFSVIALLKSTLVAARVETPEPGTAPSGLLQAQGQAEAPALAQARGEAEARAEAEAAPPPSAKATAVAGSCAVGGKVLDFDGTADAGRQLIAQQVCQPLVERYGGCMVVLKVKVS